MKKLLLIFLLIPVLASSQWLEMGKQKIGNKVGIQSSGVYQWALDFNGSTEYLSCTPALRLTGEYSLYDNFSDGNYDGWTVSSGAYSVVDSTPLSGGTKSLKCTTAGIIYIPCNQVYGQWEFDLVFATGSTFIVGIINSKNSFTADDGYRLGLISGVSFSRRATGVSTAIFLTNTNYVLPNTKYRIKITRNTNGSFTTYIKGGTFGSDYVLVSVTGGGGTNPVTDNTYTLSNYFVLDLDANDMIANIVCQQGEGSLDLNSYERIYHSNNRAFEDTTGFRWATNGTHSIVRNTDGVSSNTYVSDFSAGVNGWSIQEGVTIDGNIDGIGGEDNTLRMTSDNANSAHVSILLSVTTASTVYKYSFRYYIPSSNTTLKKLALWDGSSINISGNQSTLDSWTTVSGYYTATQTNFRLYGLNNSSNTTFTGTAGDVFYVKDIIIQKLESRTGYSGKVISTDVGDSTTNYISLPAVNFDTLKTDVNGIYEKYTLEFWVKSKALSRVIIKVGNQVKTSDTISNIAFEKVVFNFQSNALVSNQPILLYLNQADTVYLDDVSLTKSYDVNIGVFGYPTSTSYKALLGNTQGATAGYDMGTQTSYIVRTEFVSSSTNLITIDASGTQITNAYSLYNSMINRIDSVSAYRNGVASAKKLSATIGSIVNTGTMNIGARLNADSKFQGTIGHIQITKFTDISQSNVNSTTLTTAYNRGKLIQNEWTGGSPIEVAFYDWKGADITEILRDKSGTGNNLTGTNITIDDRIKVKGKFK